MRCFIALPLPADVKAELSRVQAVLAPQLSENAVRWSKPAQFHLTLDFLGELTEDEVEAVKGRLSSLESPPFRLELESLGTFGRPARVLFVNVTGDLAALRELQGEVALGGTVQRFHPHLTLARLRTGLPNLREVTREACVRPLAWQTQEVQLVQSTLMPEGARYAPL